MSIKGKAYIVGAYEHPTREAPDKSLAAAARRVRQGRAGRRGPDARTTSTATSAPATRRGSARCRWPTTWACKLPAHGLHRDRRLVLHRARRPRRRRRSPPGKCTVALITLGRPAARARAWRPAPRRAARRRAGAGGRLRGPTAARRSTCYAHGAPRATCTSTARPASSSPGSRSRPRTTRSTTRTPCCANVVTVEEVVNSPMIADPLHRLDCCVITDGGGALIVVSARDRREPEAAEGQGDRRGRGAQGPRRRRGST